jgi:hypothetical protein
VNIAIVAQLAGLGKRAPDEIRPLGGSGDLGSVGIHREFITAAARWIMEAKL